MGWTWHFTKKKGRHSCLVFNQNSKHQLKTAHFYMVALNGPAINEKPRQGFKVYLKADMIVIVCEGNWLGN